MSPRLAGQTIVFVKSCSCRPYPPRPFRSTPTAFRQLPRHIHSPHAAHPEQKIRLSGVGWSSTAFVVCFAVGASIGIGFELLRPLRVSVSPPLVEEEGEGRDEAASMAATAAPPGRPGTLTPEQEIKLRELWALALRVFGVLDSPSNETTPNGKSPPPSLSRQSSDHGSSDQARKKKGRLSLFRKKHKDGSGSAEDFEAETSAGGSGANTPGECEGRTQLCIASSGLRAM
jgi:hypothetical protein